MSKFEPKLSPVPKMLEGMSEDKLKEIKLYFLQGHSPSIIAKVIQSDWQLLPGAKRASLVKTLQRYRDNAITDIEIVNHHGIPEAAVEAVQRIGRMVNVLEEYQDLITISMGRVRTSYNEEVASQTPSKTLGADLETANRILNNYGNLGIKAGLMKSLSVEDSQRALRGVMVSEMSEAVLGQPKLKQGLVFLLGNLIEEIKATSDAAAG